MIKCFKIFILVLFIYFHSFTNNDNKFSYLIIEYNNLIELDIFLKEFQNRLPFDIAVRKLIVHNPKSYLLLSRKLEVDQILKIAISIDDFDIYESEVNGKWLILSISFKRGLNIEELIQDNCIPNAAA